jgi:hypothetical protein
VGRSTEVCLGACGRAQQEARYPDNKPAICAEASSFAGLSRASVRLRVRPITAAQLARAQASLGRQTLSVRPTSFIVTLVCPRSAPALEQRGKQNTGLGHSTLSLPLGTTLSGASATRRSPPTSRRQCTPPRILRSRVPRPITRTKLLQARTCSRSGARLSGANACRPSEPHSSGLCRSRSRALRQLRRTPPHPGARTSQPGGRRSSLRTVPGSRGLLTGSTVSACLAQTRLEKARMKITRSLPA